MTRHLDVYREAPPLAWLRYGGSEHGVHSSLVGAELERLAVVHDLEALEHRSTVGAVLECVEAHGYSREVPE
jgi:hypothetical protein